MAGARAVLAGAGGRGADGGGPGDPRGEPGGVRRPAGSGGASLAGRAGEPEADRAVDAEAGRSGSVAAEAGLPTTIRAAGSRPAPDLVERDFRAEAPNRLWVADVTYVPTKARTVRLAVVVDAFSQRVVGWWMSLRLFSSLVVKAPRMAVERRRPEGVVHHSARGSPYASLEFGAAWRRAGARRSMGSAGDCCDNAMAALGAEVRGPGGVRTELRGANVNAVRRTPREGARRRSENSELSTKAGQAHTALSWRITPNDRSNGLCRRRARRIQSQMLVGQSSAGLQLVSAQILSAALDEPIDEQRQFAAAGPGSSPPFGPPAGVSPSILEVPDRQVP